MISYSPSFIRIHVRMQFKYFVWPANFHFFFGRQECFHLNSYLKSVGCLSYSPTNLKFWLLFVICWLSIYNLHSACTPSFCIQVQCRNWWLPFDAHIPSFNKNKVAKNCKRSDISQKLLFRIWLPSNPLPHTQELTILYN